MGARHCRRKRRVRSSCLGKMKSSSQGLRRAEVSQSTVTPGILTRDTD